VTRADLRAEVLLCLRCARGPWRWVMAEHGCEVALVLCEMVTAECAAWAAGGDAR
jgi:hypothetical protein